MIAGTARSGRKLKDGCKVHKASEIIQGRKIDPPRKLRGQVLCMQVGKLEPGAGCGILTRSGSFQNRLVEVLT